jgi:cytochrome b561
MPDGIMNKVVGIGIGLTVLFLLLASVIMPNYNIAGSTNISGTGLTATTYTGLLLLVFVLAIVGIALTFLRKK